MSTKTTLKRIALVAVSALGAGLLSIVSTPAANAATFGAISVGTIPAARPGSTITVPITINVTPASSGETITVAAKAVSAPTSGGLSNAPSVFASTTSTTNADAAGAVLYFGTAAGQISATSTATDGYLAQTAGTDKANEKSYIGVFKAGTTAAGNTSAASVTGGVPATAWEQATTGTTATTVTTYLTIKPDLAGTYSFIVSVSDSAARNSYAAGDTSTTFSFTTAGTPTTATLTNIGGSTSHSGSYGALYRLTFKDAAGNATTLVSDEAFTITPSGANIAKASVSSGAFASVTPSAATAVSFGPADLVNGVGFMNVDATAAATTVVLTGVGGGTLSPTVTATASTTSAAGAATGAGITITFAGAASTNNSVTTGWVGTTRVIPNTATSSTIELTRAAADNTAAYYGYLTIQDTTGYITGVAQTGQTLTYDRAYTMAAAANFTTVSVSHAACSAGTCYTVTPNTSATGISGTVTAAATTLSSSSGSLTVLAPSSSIRLATGGSVTFSVSVRDQFRRLVASTPVTVSFSGRNSAKTTATVATNASGVAEYTFTDTGTSGTSDTITFSASGAANTATITYGTAVAGSVLVATPSTNSVTATTLPGEDAYPKAFSEIYATDGAEGGAVTVTALVKDADGNVMSGVPVTWSVTGTGCAILSTGATSYTGANGQATSSLYDWSAGTCVVKAAAGGKEDTANSYWRQSGEVRTIEAAVTGNNITATVKDRFGNPVRSIDVRVTRVSGTGFVGSATSATAATDENGQVSFAVTGGAAKFKVGFTDETFQQSDALKGLIDGVSTAAANKFTAYTAGTALVAEEGVGSTFDAAGVNSVTVDVTAEDASVSAANAASDAAAEAIDAANAATDAANLAAEAADAATVAAEEARDAADAATAAVEELATQVATLMAALKAQITTLANTVAKIAKKVRA